MESTIEFYLKNAERFIRDTIDVDMSSCYEHFEKHVKERGVIMDLGCGSGRDSLHFLEKGYDVISIDAAESMCYATKSLTKGIVRCLRFDELDYFDMFDGVWANASLLHVPKKNMHEILSLIVRAMKDNAVLYVSYKYGNRERIKDGRIYSDYTKDTLRELIMSINGLKIVELWTSKDVRVTRDDKWVNLICKKYKGREYNDRVQGVNVVKEK